VALVATGPGRFSLDRALGWEDEISGPWWALGVAGAALAVAVLVLTVGRRRAVPEPRAA
jgi:hypothetical protein